MRCAAAISEIGHTGHSEEIHSPDECARTVVRRRRPAVPKARKFGGNGGIEHVDLLQMQFKQKNDGEV
jgi:hypothetical protein